MNDNEQRDPDPEKESWEPSDILEVMLFIQLIVKNVNDRKDAKAYSNEDVFQLYEENMRLKAELSLLEDLINRKFK